MVIAAIDVAARRRRKASWRSGYAEDCKSLHPGSIPGEASKIPDSVILAVIDPVSVPGQSPSRATTGDVGSV